MLMSNIIFEGLGVRVSGAKPLSRQAKGSQHFVMEAIDDGSDIPTKLGTLAVDAHANGARIKLDLDTAVVHLAAVALNRFTHAVHNEISPLVGIMLERRDSDVEAAVVTEAGYTPGKPAGLYDVYWSAAEETK